MFKSMLHKTVRLVKVVSFTLVIFSLGFTTAGCGRVVQETFRATGRLTVAALKDTADVAQGMATVLEGDPNDN